MKKVAGTTALCEAVWASPGVRNATKPAIWKLNELRDFINEKETRLFSGHKKHLVSNSNLPYTVPYNEWIK